MVPPLRAALGGTDSAGTYERPIMEANLAAVQAQAKAALDRANYVKTIYDPVWGRLDALEARPAGVSRA